MRSLDEALARFQLGGLEYLGGRANHGPMAAEALVALGHPALLDGWIDVYAPRLPPLEVGEPIAVPDRAAARGRPERMPDWVATWEAELERVGWRPLLERELPAALDGLAGGALPGWLRVAHAVRALLREDTPVRRREVALGLALWTARHRPLDGAAPGRPARVDVAARLAAVPVVPEERRRLEERRPPEGAGEAVRALEGDAAFAQWARSVPLPDDPEACIAALCREAARLYLEHPAARTAYVPAVTAPAAWRLLAPLLAAEDAARAARRLLQAVGGLHAVSRPAPGAPPVLSAEAAAWSSGGAEDPAASAARVARDPEEVRYRAACSLQEHAIEMAEACLREHALDPDPVLCRAAADAALHIT